METLEVPYGNMTLVLRSITEEEMAAQGLRIRPAGIYFADDLLVRSDLSTWKIVDKRHNDEDK